MADVDLEALDLATLSWLAGGAGNEHLLGAIQAEGHPQLRISHGYVFQLLIEGSLTIGEIAEGLGVTQQGASKAVAELVALGYLDLSEGENDRRVRQVALSAQGRKAVADARAARRRLDKKLTAKLGDAGMQAAREALIVLLGEVGGMSAVRGRRVRQPRVE